MLLWKLENLVEAAGTQRPGSHPVFTFFKDGLAKKNKNKKKSAHAAPQVTLAHTSLVLVHIDTGTDGVKRR